MLDISARRRPDTMTPEAAAALCSLVEARPVAALGTLQEGAPFVSMAPYALAADRAAFVIHVSPLAAHTRDMQRDPRVSLLIVQADDAATLPQALARLTVSGTAEAVARDAPGWAAARAAYLGRFPEAAPIAELPDFLFFLIRPTAVRYVAGFGQARSLSPEAFLKVLQRRTA
jgi:hypothetical protein